MAVYGVPSELDGALPWPWAEERLARCRNFWVATVDPTGAPHAMPVWGVWMADAEVFFFSCAPSSLKARNLSTNPQVVVAIESTTECVSIEGVATPLDPGLAADGYVAAYVAKYEPDPDLAEAMAGFVGSHAMYEVRPRKAFGIIETEADFGPRATRWVWDSGAEPTGGGDHQR